MRGNNPEFLTPREKAEFEQELTVAEKQAQFGLEAKKLDLEIKKLETQWTQAFRLPFAIIMLPVRFVLAFAVPISLIVKKDLPNSYWDYMKHL